VSYLLSIRCRGVTSEPDPDVPGATVATLLGVEPGDLERAIEGAGCRIVWVDKRAIGREPGNEAAH
jgi:hypothetical protein